MTISSRWQQARNNQNKKPETITLPSKAHMYHKFLTETTLSDSWNTLSCGPNSMLANKSELIYTPTMQKSLMKRCKIKEKKLQPLLTNLRISLHLHLAMLCHPCRSRHLAYSWNTGTPLGGQTTEPPCPAASGFRAHIVSLSISTFLCFAAIVDL